MKFHNWFHALTATAMVALVAGTLAAQDSKPVQDTKPAQEQKPKLEPTKPESVEKIAKIGEAAPLFTLKDVDDKEHSLANLKGKIVVLEWFNPDCPVVRMHYKAKTFQALREKFKDKEVVFLAINSAPPATKPGTLERNREVIAERKLPDILLLDRDGKVAKSYGSKVTPTMCVVDMEGRLAYRGAIDDGNTEAPGKINYVELAVTSLLSKQPVATPETTAYGCPIQL